MLLLFLVISSIVGTIFFVINKQENHKTRRLLNVVAVIVLSLFHLILILVEDASHPQKNSLLTELRPIGLLTTILYLEGLFIGQQLYKYKMIAKSFLLYLVLFVASSGIIIFIFIAIFIILWVVVYGGLPTR